MIIGIDLGNYAVKTSEKIHLLSKISEMSGFDNSKEVIYEGVKIRVGEGEFQTDFNKSKKENTLPLLYTALAKSSNENNFKVVVGLPVGKYKQNKDELREYILNNSLKEINKRKIRITDVIIAPEGASTISNIKKDTKHPILVVDIGGRTTDITLFKSNYGKRKIDSYKTIDVGSLGVYNDIVKKINEEYTQNFRLEDAEDILLNGIFLCGEKKDASFITAIIKRYFDTILKELNMNFKLDQGYIYLTGGGSTLFEIAFRNRFKNLIVSSNRIFDNAIGFEKVGEQIWLGK